MLNGKVCLLLAENEPPISELITDLIRAGMHVVSSNDSTVALKMALKERAAVAILADLSSGVTTFEMCRALKGNPATAPISIVVTTSTSTEIDRVLALESGADDCVAKPFSVRELVLRAQAVLRRKDFQRMRNRGYTIGAISLDPDRHCATVQGTPVKLTAIEFRLLTALIRNSGYVQSRQALLNAVWVSTHEENTRTVDTHLCRLRDKLGVAGEQIHTIQGIGYRLDAE